MECYKIKKEERSHSCGYDSIVVNLSRQEAIELIQSLSSQLSHDNPNHGRQESFTDTGDYFSVFVLERE